LNTREGQKDRERERESERKSVRARTGKQEKGRESER